MSDRLNILTPDILLRAYAAGIFPMAESAEAQELHWYDPAVRALIPLDERFHIPRRLARTLRQSPYQVTVNKEFEHVLRGCAASTAGRETTWINRDIFSLYTALHKRGHAHSIEIWQDANLVGGLYGVSLGRAFFGESMFSRERDTSKIALVYLVMLLRHCGYRLLDTQFQTEHLSRFGTFEVTRDDYHRLLAEALQSNATPLPTMPDWGHLLALSLQPVTQIS